MKMTLRATCAAVALSCTPLVLAAEDQKTPAAATGSAAAAPPAAASPQGADAASATAEKGLAAVYSDRLHGRRTASGQIYDRNQLTAAHKSLAFGTLVKITNVSNQKNVTVRINDRGPTQPGRILDISPRAAQALGIRPTGMGEVIAEAVREAPKRGKS